MDVARPRKRQLLDSKWLGESTFGRERLCKSRRHKVGERSAGDTDTGGGDVSCSRCSAAWVPWNRKWRSLAPKGRNNGRDEQGFWSRDESRGHFLLRFVAPLSWRSVRWGQLPAPTAAAGGFHQERRSDDIAANFAKRGEPPRSQPLFF